VVKPFKRPPQREEVLAMDYSQLHQIVLDYLWKNPNGYFHLLCDFVRGKANELNLPYGEKDMSHVFEFFHELYRGGVIVPGLRPKPDIQRSPADYMNWASYWVTEYGRKALETKDYVPHDPEGYLARLSSSIPNLDSTITRYMEEALGCFNGGYMLAAAVMIGCGAEKSMLLLIEAFGEALGNPDEQASYKKTVKKNWMIGPKYEEFWKSLEKKLNLLPQNLSDDLHTVLDRVFDLIRSTRNDAGHPSGKTIDRDMVRANFILFPIYCKRVFGLIEYFQSAKI
jgi:hypothetical protein